MRIEKFHHVAFRCTDAKETVDFYKRVLNMDLVGAMAEDKVPSTKEPDPYMFGSGITNSGLLNITKSLSTEFGEDNVLVNAVCPGWVATNLWQRNAQGLQAELGVKSEEEARRLEIGRAHV